MRMACRVSQMHVSAAHTTRMMNSGQAAAQ